MRNADFACVMLIFAMHNADFACVMLIFAMHNADFCMHNADFCMHNADFCAQGFRVKFFVPAQVLGLGRGILRSSITLEARDGIL